MVASPRRLIDYLKFQDTADRMAADFVNRTKDMAFNRTSILFSDALCVCALCEMFEVDYLLESGTGFGGSTEMLARYFAGGHRVRRIWSVDLAVTPLRAWYLRWFGERNRHVWSTANGAQAQARRRLSAFSQVELVHGDGTLELPKLVRSLTGAGSRVGVLIDGPKEAAQLHLAETLLAATPLVCFAALDDVGPAMGDGTRYARFLSSRYAAFATSDRDFFDRYVHVNLGRLPDRMRAQPAHTGDGVGILVNTMECNLAGSPPMAR